MSLKDIEKLKEKVDKDPNSKLFVPLAEEYRKEGMLDEAIQVLLNGIERQPAYMSARVSLGKIYVEKAMLPEARAEFENVIKSIPDNLYAHKKLAEIYRDTGERDSAIKAYRVILRLNALDEDAQINLADLEATAPPEPPASAGQPERDMVVENTSLAEEDVAEVLPPPLPEEASAAAPAVSQDDLDAFKSSLFGEEPAGAEEAVALIEEEEIGNMEEADEGAISFGDINEVLADKPVVPEPAPVVPEPAPIVPEPAPIVPEPAPVVAEPAPVVPEPAPVVPEPAPVVAEPDAFDELWAAEDVVTPAAVMQTSRELSETPAEAPPLPAMEPEPFVPPVMPAEPTLRAAETAVAQTTQSKNAVEEADRLVSSGDFGGAISIYRQMLEKDPGDRRILQRVEELRTLLKLMGKDKEFLVGKLNSFLEGITKRRDEFFRNP